MTIIVGWQLSNKDAQLDIFEELMRFYTDVPKNNQDRRMLTIIKQLNQNLDLIDFLQFQFEY
ncbi:unnamed protein product [Paramecium sonneborni]|uniref:Uncharacterized protein n=1 Tax=Paramecium sonneborni TaxID=65129 RepID=A0A8S1PXF1_9CILI|nr:unnamed protein product [Paramecium sonneborni]